MFAQYVISLGCYQILRKENYILVFSGVLLLDGKNRCEGEFIRITAFTLRLHGIVGRLYLLCSGSKIREETMKHLSLLF